MIDLTSKLSSITKKRVNDKSTLGSFITAVVSAVCTIYLHLPPEEALAIGTAVAFIIPD
jgi:hypothetical protein